MTQLITTIILVVLGAALFASLEAAFFTMSLGRAKVLHEKRKPGSRALLKVKERVNRPITTLVILNNATNIVGSIYVGHMVTELYGDTLLGTISAVLTGTIIIFGEIIPKMIGENYSEKMSLTFAAPVLFVTQIFMPLIYTVEFITRGFMKHNRVISEEELTVLSQMGEAEGSIEKDEHEIIQRVFTLNDLSAKDIMTPRTVMEGIEGASRVGSIEHILYNKPYSRYPVFGDSPDEIIGICTSQELLTCLSQDKKDRLVKEVMSPALFVNEKRKVDDLLTFFQRERAHMAIVQDDFGGTAGLVTLEDVLEQLVGEIVDETDEHVDLRVHAKRQRYDKN
jgi:CBS domain containing-hemolysin-like protein